MHDARERNWEQPALLLLHLVDQIGHVQEVALGAVELRVPADEPGDVRRVAGLERGHHLGRELGTPDDLVVDLAFLDARLLSVGVALLLHDLVDLRSEGGGVPHDQLGLARGVGPPREPPGCGCRHDGGGLPRLPQDIASGQHRWPPYPFTPPSVNPLTTQRWKTRNMSTGGSALMTVEAINGPQKNTSCDMKFTSPVVSVRALVVLVKTYAYRNSFQAWVNEKNVTTTRA